eukprot:5491764-Pleurochrysis_carterae.AAC.1
MSLKDTRAISTFSAAAHFFSLLDSSFPSATVPRAGTLRISLRQEGKHPKVVYRRMLDEGDLAYYPGWQPHGLVSVEHPQVRARIAHARQEAHARARTRAHARSDAP